MQWPRTLKYGFRYGTRFLTNPGFRRHVFGLLERATTPVSAAAVDEDPAPALVDLAAIKGKNVYLCGGCEFDFVDLALEEDGLVTYHTYKYGHATDPVLDFRNPESPLWENEPDAIVLSNVPSFCDVVKRLHRGGFRLAPSEQKEALDRTIAHYEAAVSLAQSKIRKPIFIFTYPIRPRPSLGIHDYTSETESLSYTEFFRTYELMLYQLARRFDGVYILDVNSILAEIGIRAGIDIDSASGYYDHLSRRGAVAVARNIERQLLVLSRQYPRIKCAVFDLDGTLWRGVIREDGADGIHPHWPLFGVMHDLATRGVLLALCSKNWLPKSHNLKEIAKELNIGLDSLAFFDDNARERAEVLENAKGVRVYTEKDILCAIERPEFEPLGGITEEALTRVEKYVEQSHRQKAEQAYDSKDYERFLEASELKLEIRPPLAGEIGRVDELIQRSNQLNATMNRTRRAELNRFFAQPADYGIFIANLKDKFGEYGLIGVAVVEKASHATWEILELAFSCRAMGRRVEHALINSLCATARNDGASRVALSFVETPRNRQMLEILRDVGFRAHESAPTRLTQDLTSAPLALPKWFHLVDGVTAGACS